MTVHGPVQLNPRPDNQRRVRALASAPHLVPLGVYYVLALSMGKKTEIESEGARHTHPRARAVALHTCSVGPARLRPPSYLTTAPRLLHPSLAHLVPPAPAHTRDPLCSPTRTFDGVGDL